MTSPETELLGGRGQWMKQVSSQVTGSHRHAFPFVPKFGLPYWLQSVAFIAGLDYAEHWVQPNQISNSNSNLRPPPAEE